MTGYHFRLSILLQNENFSGILIEDITYLKHLSKLITEFEHYIPDTDTEALLDEIANIRNLQKQVIEIQNDETLPYDFSRQNKSLR